MSKNSGRHIIAILRGKVHSFTKSLKIQFHLPETLETYNFSTLSNFTNFKVLICKGGGILILGKFSDQRPTILLRLPLQTLKTLNVFPIHSYS